MNREFYREMARKQAIVEARAQHKPLDTWPGDGNIGVAELPEVSKEYVEANPPTNTWELWHRQNMALMTSRRYGIVASRFELGKGMIYTIGEWM